MDRSLRSSRRRGVSSAIPLVAIILVGASVAVGLTVFSFSQAGSVAPTPSTPSPRSITTVATTSSAAASSSTVSLASSSTSSIPCLLNSTGVANMTQLNATIGALWGNLTDAFNQGPGNVTVAQLFGNFTQMTLTSNVTGTFNANWTFDLVTTSSYQVVARPMIGSLEYYDVDFNISAAGFNDSQTVMFAPNGTATSVSSPVLGNFTGASAQTMGEGDVSSFLIQLHSSAYVKSMESDPGIAVLNSTTVSLGSTQVKMTYYTLKSLPRPTAEPP